LRVRRKPDGAGVIHGGLLRLETKGRRTGLPHVVELRYSVRGGSFYVMAGEPRSDWVLNCVRSGRCTVRVGELLYEASAAQATETETSAAKRAFRQRYGGRFVDGWYREPVCLRLTPEGPPEKRGAIRGESETKTTFGEWSGTRRNYYSEVATAFDSASNEYDFTISRNFINSWIRKRSVGVLSQYLRPEFTVLEIGCGTGAEAIEISKRVAKVVATDVSQGMVELLKTKVRAKGLEGRIVAMKLAASEVGRIGDPMAAGKFPLAYSFNGALNCEPRLEEFARQLHELLVPRGILVCSIRNTLCFTEAVAHAAALQFGRMSPRKRQPVMVSVGGREIPSTYYSPDRFLQKMRPYFEAEEVIALPALLPPAYLNDYYLRVRSVTSMVERLDAALSGHFPLNRVGDQTLFVLRRIDRAL
jgi:SAM-dependent methyltransferase